MDEEQRSKPDPNLPASPLSASGRVVFAILLVVLLIVVLGRPILVAGLNENGDNADGPAPAPRPSHHHTSPSAPTRLVSRYPSECRKTVTPEAPGRVATVFEGRVGAFAIPIASGFKVRSGGPVGWSPSGRDLAVGGADLWTYRGRHVGYAFGFPVARWAWSPVADCMLGIANGSLQVAIRSSRPQVLLNQEVTNFGFSPDGHRVVYSVESPHAEAGIWMADLMSGRTKLLQRDSDATWTVYAWSAADRPIMLGSNDGGPPMQFAASDQVDVCGHEILSIADHRIATFGVTGSPDYLATPAGWRFTALSCAPNGEFIAAIGTRSAAAVGGTLLILDGNGNIVQELGTPGYVDLHPLWGPPGSGVVFLQTASGTGPTTVTYISEGGRSMPQKLSVSGDFDANMDWSADGPLGHPTN